MTKNQDYISRVVWLKESLSTRDFMDWYKNYCIVIKGYYESYDFMNLIIYKLVRNNTLVLKVYENLNREEILMLFGNKLQENSYNTVHKKIINFIKNYDL